MRMPITNTFKGLAYLVVISTLAVYLITGYVFHSDKSIPAVEKFMASNGEVAAQIGNIKKFDLTKRVAVSATETSNAYRLYTFMVDGDKAKARIVVRVEEEGTRELFSVSRLEVYKPA